MTVEEYLQKWMSQHPSFQVTPEELQFVEAVRKAKAGEVGYGWMQDIIEVEWQHVQPGGAWGPNYFRKTIQKLERIIREMS